MEADTSEKQHQFNLIVNRQDKHWPREFINGAEILQLAGSPADWVVNEIVPGGGEDPEVGPQQPVDLSPHASPHGTKKFLTRKPKTSPGHV